MDYNEDLVEHVTRLERAVSKSGLPAEAKRKLNSLIGCLEYQVEEGDWPDDVVVHLGNAIQAWLESEPQGKSLIPKLEECIKTIASENP